MANSTLKEINWFKSIPFLTVHLMALGVFFIPFEWKYVGLCLALYFIRMFAITAGYHRYFSHRTYKMSRIPQFLMALLGTTSLQKGVLWWAAHHRIHHKKSDLVDDVHSPFQRGFWWSHVAWILSNKHDETHWEQIQDLAKFPELRWLNKHHWVPGVALAVGIFFLAGGLGALIWGFFLSTVLLWHGTFTINSLSHVIGSRRYVTTDTSRNNFALALVTMGEGWHNNHHCYMSSANQGFFWWEVDMSFYLLKLLSTVGIVKDLRKPPLELLDAKRIDRGARDLMPRKQEARAQIQPIRSRA